MVNTSLTKIALADDHVLVRAGLAQIINRHEDLKVMNEASNGVELLEILKSEPIDVVLLDLDMPVMDGKATLERIIAEYPTVKVIMLTVHQHDSFIVHMMKAGAHGYLLKESEPEEVIKAIRTVKEEGIYFNDKVSRALLRNASNPKSGHQALGGESLNQREIDILVLICKEQTTNQIADILFLSAKTIEGYRKSLLEKTGTKNVAGLAIYAVKNGLI
jgi:DNA-binding NarL/FixJ family response regulator